ncbi:MAG: ATP-binding protein [Acidobacteriota bacterium]|nr:ATP-binding protein [Acidobacteriota bacterium]
MFDKEKRARGEAGLRRRVALALRGLLPGGVSGPAPSSFRPPHESAALSGRLTYFASLGIALAIAAGAGCLLVGSMSARSARTAIVEKIRDSHLGLARVMASHLAEHGEGARDRRRVVDSVRRLWSETESRYPGRYVCLLDETGRIVLNTLRPETVGRDASEVALGQAAEGGPRSVGDLLRSRSNWVGENASLAGERQIVAYAHMPATDGLIAVHVPLSVIDAEFRSAVLPFSIGLGVIALGLLPLSIGLLLWAFSRSQRAVVRSLEQQERLRGELLQAQKMEAVGRLAGGIAHDFNNLMTAVLGYADLAERRAGGDEVLEDDIREIKKAIGRATDLTRQLLAFSRRQLLEAEPFDLNAIIADMSGLVRRLIGEDVELVIDIGAESGWIEADPGQIEQVVLNLAVNARDAMPDGGRLTIETGSCTLDAEQVSSFDELSPGRYVQLSIKDSGPGMDREIQRRAFEPFFTTKGPGKGTGLGLSTVYGIVKQSGGDVWIDSVAGVGTSVSMVLPEVEPVGRAPVAETGAESRASGRGTILLVEDDDDVRDLVSKVLRRAGYDLVEAREGREALRIWTECKDEVDLVITDVVMPGLGGREVAERVRRDRPDCDVLFVSGYADRSGDDLAERFPGAVRLPKPFTPDRLTGVVARILSARRAAKVTTTVRAS